MIKEYVLTCEKCGKSVIMSDEIWGRSIKTDFCPVFSANTEDQHDDEDCDGLNEIYADENRSPKDWVTFCEVKDCDERTTGTETLDGSAVYAWWCPKHRHLRTAGMTLAGKVKWYFGFHLRFGYLRAVRQWFFNHVGYRWMIWQQERQWRQWRRLHPDIEF